MSSRDNGDVVYGPQTLTFLFTDVEASTRRWAADQEKMALELALHDEVLRSTVADHRGEIFKHTGDGICAVFGSAADAAHAALTAQERLALPVRMGLHTGEAEHRDGDWYGATLSRAARIMDAGHGGQVLASAATVALLPWDVPRVPLGEFRLKGLDAPEVIVQIGAGVFPPLRAGPTTVELPGRRTALLGRDDLLSRIDATLDAHRLVTLVGPGGVGKTSVATEAARRRTGLVERIVFADLAAVDDDDGVVAAVARALGVTSPGIAAIELALGSSDLLIVVDSCEHVIDAAAELVDVLLARGARVLATSREHLELDGEIVVPVPPLSDSAVAVSLFVQRATAAGAPAPAPADRARIAELCRRLDGLPLAIELAASRLNVLSVGQLLDHLGDRLDLLSSGRRRGRDRHRTLRDTIAWSYDLLSPDEQDLYRRLSVFVDWFALDDAVAVSAETRPIKVLDVLGALASKSLLVVSDTDAGARYRYLESIRHHAWGLLVESGADDAVMYTLADHLANALGKLSTRVWEGPDGDLFGEMRRLLPLQQHALEWALHRHDVARAKALMMPFAGALPMGLPLAFAGAQRLVDLMQSGAERDPDVLALRLVDRLYRRHFDRFRVVLEEIVSLTDFHTASAELASMLVFAAGITGREEDRVRDLIAAVPVRGAFAKWISIFAAPLDEDSLARGLKLMDEMPTRYGFASVGAFVARVAQALDRPETAAQVSDRVLAAFSEPSAAWTSAWSHKAAYHLGRGELRAAVDCAERVIETARKFGEHSAFVPVFAMHALILAKLDHACDAARVRGLAPKRWALFFLRERDELDSWLAQRFTAHELATLAAEGRAMDLDELLSIAPAAVAATAPT